MLAGRDRLADEAGAHAGQRAIEVDGVGRVAQAGRQIGAPARQAVALGDGADLVLGAADQHGVGPETVAIGKRDAALLADGEDGADEVLVLSHAPRDAVHDNADGVAGHGRNCNRGSESWYAG